MRLIGAGLEIWRGEDCVIHNLSFAVSAGHALIITGTNGSGKSTLLRGVAGLLPLEAGAVQLDNQEAEFTGVPLANLCHYLGHENAMKPALSVGENLTFWREFCGSPHLDIPEALEMLGLKRLIDVPFGHLSTGLRRRASIARLLVSWRPIWLMDEPTAGLDGASEAQLMALIGAHLEDDGTAMIATHLPLDLPGSRIEPLVIGAS